MKAKGLVCGVCAKTHASWDDWLDSRHEIYRGTVMTQNAGSCSICGKTYSHASYFNWMPIKTLPIDLDKADIEMLIWMVKDCNVFNKERRQNVLKALSEATVVDWDEVVEVEDF